MGGKISNLIKKKDDEEEIARKYEVPLDADGNFVYSDEPEKREVRWWERILFDRRLKIMYVLILGLLLGILIPMVVFMTKLQSNDRTIYGSCLIRENARFQCLINSVKIEDEDSCVKALCCWENSNDLPFKCYHSFPSAYQYIVSDEKRSNQSGTEWTDLTMTPNQKSQMSNLQLRVRWVTSAHVFLEFFNPSLVDAEEVMYGEENGPGESLPFNVSWADYDNFFYVRIARQETDETIFDTRLGPLISASDYISLATVLPTPYFYGLRGGQSALSSLTYGVVHGFENVELPFYISYEASGKWHGVLLDTNDPFLVKVVQAPGIMFYLETDLPKVGLHFFSGPTQPEIFSQLHKHIQQKYGISHPPAIPPYWGLGLHICRKIDNITTFPEHLEELLETIPYDSDCIDENLRRPFELDKEKFENFSDIQALLDKHKKRILLSQKVTIPWEDNTNIPLLLNVTNSKIETFKGFMNNESVKYIDVFNSNFDSFPLPINLPFSGMNLIDNFPQLNYAQETCAEPATRIQSLFSNPTSSSNSSLNGTMLWGSVCPEVRHFENGTEVKYIRHLKYHNTYGQQSLKLLHDSLLSINKDEPLIASASVWTTSLYYGGFTGLPVPFTWRGLQDSVAYTVRNYALSPVIGTPICGSSVFNSSLPSNDDLCLRWFQFGLLLPLAMNSYDGYSSYGPLDLAGQNIGYLAEAIRQRYSFAPYYFTTLVQYQRNYVPFVRPMSFHFDTEKDKNRTLPILNQFMIGDAILAAPIIDRGVSRTAYFPAGVWYNKEGLVAWDNENEGSLKSITGHITETPLFFRGGYIVPTLMEDIDNPVFDIESSLQSDYYLFISLTSANSVDGSQIAEGTLSLKATNDNFHELQFKAYSNNGIMRIQQHAKCAKSNVGIDEHFLPPSTTVDQVVIFGFSLSVNAKITVNPQQNDNTPHGYYDLDNKALRISNLKLNWCKSEHYEITISDIDLSTTTESADTDISSSDFSSSPTDTEQSTTTTNVP